MYIFPSLALRSSVQWRFAHQIAEIRWGRNLARHAECALTKPTACCLWFLYMSILKEMQNVYQYCKWQLTWRNSKINKFISAWMEPFVNSFFVYIQMLIFTQLTDKPLRIFFFFCLCCCTSYSRTFECYIQMTPVHQRMVQIFESLEISATWISNIPALFINFSINPFHTRPWFYGVVRKSPAML